MYMHIYTYTTETYFVIVYCITSSTVFSPSSNTANPPTKDLDFRGFDSISDSGYQGLSISDFRFDFRFSIS